MAKDAWTAPITIERNGADSIRAFTPSIANGNGGLNASHTNGNGPVARRSSEDASQQYVPGDRVFHPSFGTGVVVSSMMHGGDEEVTVAFEGKGVKKLMAAYAPLQHS
jgi:DNA helicase-2/ATP-dependent DNA helicase PcrA